MSPTELQADLVAVMTSTRSMHAASERAGDLVSARQATFMEVLRAFEVIANTRPDVFDACADDIP